MGNCRKVDLSGSECRSKCINSCCYDTYEQARFPNSLSGHSLTREGGTAAVPLPQYPGFYSLEASYFYPDQPGKKEIKLEIGLAMQIKNTYIQAYFPDLQAGLMTEDMDVPSVTAGHRVILKVWVMEPIGGVYPKVIETYSWPQYFSGNFLESNWQLLQEEEIELSLPDGTFKRAKTDVDGRATFTIDPLSVADGLVFVKLVSDEFCQVLNFLPLAVYKQKLDSEYVVYMCEKGLSIYC